MSHAIVMATKRRSKPRMKTRTLVLHHRYFGLRPDRLRGAAERVLARFTGLPPDRVRISARRLREDFEVTTIMGRVLLERLVDGGLLAPRAGKDGDYHLTPRFVEYAKARIVEPLPRARAKQLIERVVKIAAHINEDWPRNPLEIEAIAVSGGYMSRDPELSELTLAVVVRLRERIKATRFTRPMTKAEGAAEIRAALTAISSFVVPRLATDLSAAPRPFSVIFQAEPH